jgi:hypothetical protein
LTRNDVPLAVLALPRNAHANRRGNGRRR